MFNTINKIKDFLTSHHKHSNKIPSILIWQECKWTLKTVYLSFRMAKCKIRQKCSSPLNNSCLMILAMITKNKLTSRLYLSKIIIIMNCKSLRCSPELGGRSWSLRWARPSRPRRSSSRADSSASSPRAPAAHSSGEFPRTAKNGR